MSDDTREAFDIARFCDAHCIGKGSLYELWEQGIGPKVIKIGDKPLISREAAAEWRRAMEARTPQTYEEWKSRRRGGPIRRGG